MTESNQLYSFPAVTRNEKKRQREKKQQEMWKKPETLHLDLMCHTFDLDNTGVLECDDQLCDVQFVTHNLTAWKDVCLQHYVQRCEAGEINSYPSVSAIAEGSQLKVDGKITINFYTTGVVLIQGKDIHYWKDTEFQLLKDAVSQWVDEGNQSILEQKELRNSKTGQSLSPASSCDALDVGLSFDKATPSPSGDQVTETTSTSDVRSAVAMQKKVNASTKKMNATKKKTKPARKSSRKMSTHPEQSCSMSSIENDVSQTSAHDIKASPLITSTPAVHCEPINVSARVDQLNSLIDSFPMEYYANIDSSSVNVTQKDYDPDVSSLRAADGCKNCKSLEEYAAICEQAANLIRIELTTLQNKLSRISDQTTTTKQCVTPDLRPTVTSEQPIKLDHRTSRHAPQKPVKKNRVTVIGASNVRGLSGKLQTRKTETVTYVNAGRQLSQMDQRIPSMVSKDTDSVVLHLGTNDALNAPSDGQCLLNADRSLRNIARNHSRSHRSVPLMVCAVPTTTSREGQRRVEMLNHLYKRRCEDNQHLHFVETGCSARDLTEDGVHLKESGKVKVANAILQSLQDFSKPVALRHP